MKRAKQARHGKAATQLVAVPEREHSVVVPVLAPRNPYVALGHGRKAGAHGGSGRTRRQAEKRELRRQLEQE